MILSLKLSTAYLEMVFHKMSWGGGISVNGERLNRLPFADDIGLIVNNIRETRSR